MSSPDAPHHLTLGELVAFGEGGDDLRLVVLVDDPVRSLATPGDQVGGLPVQGVNFAADDNGVYLELLAAPIRT